MLKIAAVLSPTMQGPRSRLALSLIFTAVAMGACGNGANDLPTTKPTPEAVREVCVALLTALSIDPGDDPAGTVEGEMSKTIRALEVVGDAETSALSADLEDAANADEHRAATDAVRDWCQERGWSLKLR